MNLSYRSVTGFQWRVLQTEIRLKSASSIIDLFSNRKAWEGSWELNKCPPSACSWVLPPPSWKLELSGPKSGGQKPGVARWEGKVQPHFQNSSLASTTCMSTLKPSPERRFPEKDSSCQYDCCVLNFRCVPYSCIAPVFLYRADLEFLEWLHPS